MISVIVPLYNAAAWMQRAVDSVLGQTLRDWELLLVDDGSSDASLDMAKRYAEQDERIKVLHQPNGGVTAARRAGFLASKGEYVYFLDSDDCLLPHALHTLTDYQQAHDADIVKCAECIVYGDEQLPQTNAVVGTMDYEQYVVALLTARIVSTFHATLYARRLFSEDSFAIDRRFKLGEDVLTNVMLANTARKFFVANDLVLHYYFNPQSALQTQVMSYEYCAEISQMISRAIARPTPLMEHELELEHWRVVVCDFFVPELPFSAARYDALVQWKHANPSLFQELCVRLNNKQTKLINHKLLFRLYAFAYRQYLLWIRQKGKKKKVVY